MYSFFPRGSPVWERSAISKHKYRFIMAMRKNLTRKTPTLFILLIKFLAVINVYFSTKTKTLGKFSSERKVPQQRENIPSVYVKMIIISVTQGWDGKKEEISVSSSVSNSMFQKGMKKKVPTRYGRFKRLTRRRKCLKEVIVFLSLFY